MLLSTSAQKHGLWLLEAPVLYSEIDSVLNIKKKNNHFLLNLKPTGLMSYI